MRLKGRSAIVTGAASGIGHATATLFAEEGARVLAVDRPETGMAETYAGASNIVLCEQDLAAAEAAEAVVAQALDAHGGIDILYNNAGVSGRAKFDEMTDDIWERVIDVNLTAGYRRAQPCLRLKKRRAQNHLYRVGHGTHDSSLGGLLASNRHRWTCAHPDLDLGKHDHGNYVEPGAILTGMTKEGFSDPNIAAIWAKKAALRRLGQPIDWPGGVIPRIRRCWICDGSRSNRGWRPDTSHLKARDAPEQGMPMGALGVTHFMLDEVGVFLPGQFAYGRQMTRWKRPL